MEVGTRVVHRRHSWIGTVTASTSSTDMYVQWDGQEDDDCTSLDDLDFDASNARARTSDNGGAAAAPCATSGDAHRSNVAAAAASSPQSVGRKRRMVESTPAADQLRSVSGRLRRSTRLPSNGMPSAAAASTGTSALDTIGTGADSASISVSSADDDMEASTDDDADDYANAMPASNTALHFSCCVPNGDDTSSQSQQRELLAEIWNQHSNPGSQNHAELKALNPIIESVIDAGGVLVAKDLPSFRQLQSLAVCWNVPVYSDALPCDDLTAAHAAKNPCTDGYWFPDLMVHQLDADGKSIVIMGEADEQWHMTCVHRGAAGYSPEALLARFHCACGHVFPNVIAGSRIAVMNVWCEQKQISRNNFGCNDVLCEDERHQSQYVNETLDGLDENNAERNRITKRVYQRIVDRSIEYPDCPDGSALMVVCGTERDMGLRLEWSERGGQHVFDYAASLVDDTGEPCYPVHTGPDAELIIVVPIDTTIKDNAVFLDFKKRIKYDTAQNKHVPGVSATEWDQDLHERVDETIERKGRLEKVLQSPSDIVHQRYTPQQRKRAETVLRQLRRSFKSVTDICTTHIPGQDEALAQQYSDALSSTTDPTALQEAKGTYAAEVDALQQILAEGHTVLDEINQRMTALGMHDLESLQGVLASLEKSGVELTGDESWSELDRLSKLPGHEARARASGMTLYDPNDVTNADLSANAKAQSLGLSTNDASAKGQSELNALTVGAAGKFDATGMDSLEALNVAAQSKGHSSHAALCHGESDLLGVSHSTQHGKDQFIFDARYSLNGRYGRMQVCFPSQDEAKAVSKQWYGLINSGQVSSAVEMILALRRRIPASEKQEIIAVTQIEYAGDKDLFYDLALENMQCSVQGRYTVSKEAQGCLIRAFQYTMSKSRNGAAAEWREFVAQVTKDPRHWKKACALAVAHKKAERDQD
jgi:hypothetical protein